MNNYYSPTKFQTSNSSTASPSIIGKAMKTSLLIALMLLLSTGKTWAVAKSATISANIAYASIVWSPVGAPATGDDVTLTCNGTFTVSAVPTSIPATGNFATFTVAGTGTLTLTGTATTGSTIFTTKFVASGNTTLGAATIATGVSLSSANMTSTTSSVASAKTLTITSGSFVGIGTGGILTVSGSVAINGNATGLLTTAASQVSVPNGGAVTYTLTGQACQPAAMTVASGGTLTVTASSASTISQFPSPAISMAGTLNIGGSITTVGGTNAISYSGTPTLKYTNTGAFTTTANEWPAFAALAVNVNATAGQTVTFGTTSTNFTRTIASLTLTTGNFAIPTSNAITVTGASTWSSGPTLTLSGGNLTVQNAITNSATVNITTGTFDVNGANGTFAFTAGTVTLGGGTLQFTSTNAAPITRTSGFLAATSGSLYFIPASTPQTWTIPVSLFTGTLALTNFKFAMGSAGSITSNVTTDVTVATAWDLAGGQYILNSSGNLQVAGNANFNTNGGTTPSATNMIVTASTGYFKRTIASLSTAYTFPIGENTGTAEYAGFTYTQSAGTVSNTTQIVGYRVTDANPLGSLPSDYVSRYWTSFFSGTASYTYSISLPYNGTTGDIVGTEANMFGGYRIAGSWIQAGTVNTASDLVVFSGVTQTTAPLTTGNQFTGIDVACASPTGPQSFNVSSLSNTANPVTMTGTVGLSATTNVSGVIIFANTSNVNASPASFTNYNVGDVLPSGSICIFKGGTVSTSIGWTYDASLTGGTDLSPNTFYYFNIYTYSSGASCNTVYSGTWIFSSMAPNITLTAPGTATACNNTSNSFNLAYSSTSGSPDQYNLVWNAAAAAAGFVNNPSSNASNTACGSNFISLPSSPIVVSIPAGIAPGTYSGFINPKNSANGYDNCTLNGGGLSNCPSFTVTITAGTAAPTGTTPQAACPGYTVSNLVATGTAIQWYAAATGGSPLAGSTALVSGNHYYASQTVGGCESSTRLDVTVVAPLSGTVTVGSGGTYNTLSEAGAGGLFQAINTLGLGGNLTVNMLSSTTETGAVALNAWTNFCGGPWTVNIRPDATVSSTITASSTVTPITLNGVTGLTMDGVPAGSSGSNVIADSKWIIKSTSTTLPTIIFTKSSANVGCTANTLKYLQIQGQNITKGQVVGDLAGVVNFSGTPTATNGNASNIITYCAIGDNGAGTPANCIYSFGSSTASMGNDNNQVTNCNIYNFWQPATITNGLNGINLQNYNAGWTISDNSFYQTASRTATANNTTSAILVNNSVSGTGFTISNNYIGGGAAGATGSAWTITGNFVNAFTGIDVNQLTSGTSTASGNVITNISWLCANTSAVLPGIFTGILANSNGTLNITGNTIGATTGNGSITITDVTTTGANSYGIGHNTSSGFVNIQNNNIGSITLLANATTISHNFTAIQYAQGGSANARTISGNLIGSTSTANSIYANCGSSSVSTAQSVIGISNGGSGANAASITNNTIANLTNNLGGATTLAGLTYGIYVTSGVNTITGNTVRNLSSTSIYTNTNGIGTAGIYCGATASSGQTIAQNTIHSLSNTTATANAVNVTGIFYSGPASGTNSISRNFIHSLSTTSSAASFLSGIDVSGSSVCTVDNNMVRQGINANGTDLTGGHAIRGIYKNSSGACNIYFNSVYIGGASVTGTSTTSALYRATSGTGDIFKDNILVNARSNGSGTGKHYGILTGVVTGLSSNYNLIFATGTGGFVGQNAVVDYSSLTAWSSATSMDANSISGDPMFISPTGNAGTVNLHIQPSPTPTPIEATGTNISAITVDFDGQTRASYSPEDIGADADNFVPKDITGPIITYTALAADCAGSTRTFGSVNITDVQSGVNTTSGTRPRVYYKKSTDANTFNGNTSATAGWKYVEANGTTSPFDFTINYALLNAGSVASGDVIQYFIVAQDLNSTPNIGMNSGTFTASPSTVALTSGAFPLSGSINSYSIVTALSGTINVGTAQTYTTLTGAGGLFAAINAGAVGGNITALITSNITETGAVALNQWSNGGACGGGYTLTITPSAATLRTLSGAFAGSLVTLNGADRVIFDGRFNATGTTSYLTIANTQAAAANNAAIKLANDAQDNLIEYCTLKANNNAYTAGVVVFGDAATGGSGNSGNTIDHCSITANTSLALSVGIISNNTTAGTTNSTMSKGNTITYNNFFDIHSSVVSDCIGVYVTSSGNGPNWNISYNNFYSPTNYSTSQYSIDFEPGSSSYSNAINYNMIGGNAAPVAGVFTGTWTNLCTAYYRTVVQPIFVNVGGSSTGDNTVISYNQIKNITMNLTASVQDVFVGIQTVAGYCNIHHNTVGDASTLNNIYNKGTANGSTLLPQDMSFSYGIWNSSQNDVTIDNNIVAGLTTNNSASFVCGIRVGSAENTPSFSDISAGKNTVTNNTVGNLYSGSSSEIYALPGGCTGIMVYSNSNSNLVDNNLIAGINCNLAGAYNVRSIGLSLDGENTTHTGGGTVSRNSIYSVTNNNTGASTTFNPQAYGILTGYLNIPSTESYFTFQNNMISMNNPGTNDLSVVGIRDMNISPSVQKYYNNTVYLTGDNKSTGVNSSNCFYSDYNANQTQKNNIYVNNRGGGGNHRALVNGGATWGSGTADYNFYATRSTSVVNYWTSTTGYATWLTNSGVDANSQYAQVITSGTSNYTTNPATATVNPTAGNLFGDPSDQITAGKFLHIAISDLVSYQYASNNGTDLSGSGITADFDGQARLSTPDKGADEFSAFSITTTPATVGPLCNNSSTGVSVGYTNIGSFSGTYYVQISNASGVFPSFTTSSASDIIGTGSGSSPISATIPSGLTAGTGYKIRVINDSPLTYGTDNGTAFTINAPPAAVTFTSATSTNNNLTPCLVTNNYTINAQSGYTYSWSVPSGWSAVSGGTTTQITVTPSLAAGNVTASVSIAGCTATSASLSVAPITTPSAPVANGNVTPQVTSVNTNDFTANWGAVSTATSYYIDVATTPTFLLPSATIATDGFEGGTGQLNIFTVTGGAGSFVSGNTGASDGPASSAQATGGTYAYSENNGTVTIATSAINTSTYASAQMSFRLASVSVGGATNGADVGDIVTVEVSADGTTFYSTARVLGNSNAYWAYSATGSASTAYDGDATPVDFQPAGGGSRTTDGYSTVTITGLPLTSTMKIRITMLNNAAAERWVMDDFTVSAVASSMLSGYNNLLVSPTGTSLSVTGLTTLTDYYYRVRATNACGTSANSNAVKVTTISSATLTAGSLSSFGTRCFGSSTDLNFTLSGSGLDGTAATIGPLSGFQFSANGGAFGTTATYSGYAGNSFSIPITVRFLPTGSGLISFDGNIPISGCGATAITRSVTASGTDAPAQPTITAGNLSPCASTTGTYSVTNVAGVSYAWTLPSGWSGTSTTNSISATAAASGSGTVSVTPSIGSCAGTAQTWSVNVIATPAAPVANGNVSPQTTGITTTSFGANWGAVSGASTYTLNVYTGGTTSNLSENFSGFTTNAGTLDRSATLDTYLQTTGWTGTAVFEMVGYSKIGSASTKGIITTPTLNLSGGSATLNFDLGQFGTDASIVQVFLNTGSGFAQFGADITAPASITTQTISLTGLTSTSTISIRAKNATNCRFYLDNVSITSSSYTLLTSYSGLTGTTQTVGSLTPNTNYYYSLTATNSCGTSATSNLVSVTTYSAPTLTAGSLATFGTRCFGSSTDLNFNLSGTGLDGSSVTIGPLSGFQFSANGGSFGTTATYSGYAGNSFTNIPITVRFLPTGSGTVSFNGNIPAVGGAPSSINIAVTATGNDAPAQPTITAGSLTPCPSSVGTYSVANVSGVTYAWTLPAGWSGTSTTNSISATSSATQGSSGTISVVPSIGSCAGTAQTWSETVTSLPSQPSVISTPGSPCAGSTGNVYSVTNVSGVTYTWAVSGTGWSIPSASTTNSVTITAGSAAGGITVTPYVNGCAGTARTLTGISVVSSYVPTVSIANSSTYVCINSSNTFTATRTDGNGGTAAYSWKVNGTQVSTSNPYTATAGTFTNGDAIRCDMTVTGSCAVPSTATSNTYFAQKLAYSPTQLWIENFGTGTQSDVSSYTSASNPTFTFTTGGTPHPDIRTSTVSPGGGSNVFMGATGFADRSFTISGINTVGAFPNRLSFYFYNPTTTVASPDFRLEYSTDGTNFYEVNYGTISAAGWSLVSVSNVLPQSSTVSLRFTSNLQGAVNIRIDDIKLESYTTGDAAVSSSPTGPFCGSGSTTITATPTAASGLTYAWNNGSLFSPANPTINNPTTTTISSSGSVVTTNFTTTITDIFGCTSSATKTVVVNPVPNTYTVTGTGSYCSGDAGLNVGINSSQTAVNYQLYFNGSPQGSPVAGTGNPSQSLFGAQTAAGTYTIVATHSTGSCTATMTGSAVITVNPLPTAYTLSASASSYCLGGSGVTLDLSNSQTNTNYQLLVNGVATGSPVTGTGSSISFGNQIAAGTYTVTATNTSLTPNCSSTMTGSPAVTINPVASVQLGGSTAIFTQAFTSGLPSGWSINTPSGSTYDWVVTSATPSTGYTGASGGNRFTVATSAAGANSTTVSQLISQNYSISGYSNISVVWAARKTASYPGSGTFYYSTNNGSSWTQAAFIDVAGNSTWSLVNNGIAVSLPLPAGATTLKLRWDAQAVTTLSTYGLDDVSIYGLANTTTCTNLSSVAINYAASANTTGYTLTAGTAALASFVTQSGTLSSGGGTLTLVIPSGSSAGSYDFDLNLTNGASCNKTHSIPVVIAPTPSVTAVIDECAYISADKDIVLVTGSGGTTPITYTSSNVADLPLTSISNYLIPFEAPTDGLSRTFTATDASGCIASSGAVTTYNNHPTDIPYASATGTKTVDCYSKNLNRWLTFRDNANKAILSIKDNNQDLGLVTASVYREGAEPVILNSSNHSTNTGVGNCYLYPELAMKRHFAITTEKTFAQAVDVRLYFSDAELQSLITTSTVPPSNPSDGCAKGDDVHNINEVYVTKYSGPNVDGLYTNNAAGNQGGIYRMFGANVTSPNTAFDVVSSSGFSSLFSGAPTHHYLQMHVTEFSEFWLHGSDEIYPLPVDMIYLEANAINNAYIQLTWATALEVNNDGFNIERSVDGQNWSQIAFVDGHDNSTIQNDYSYDDLNVTAGIRYYYRLKQVDNDGQFKYTDIVSAMLSGDITFSVKDFVPNPAGDKTTLLITATSAQELTVEIFDIIGQKVSSNVHTLNRGLNRLDFDVSYLASGTYSAVVYSGNATFTKKLVVTK